ncbi:MAG: CapA family protein [Ignavibacteriae bacterium]|nr:CapA family protein [Ignavibacteriota bacterium]
MMIRAVLFHFAILGIAFCKPAGDSSTVILRFGGDVLLAARYEEGVGANLTTAFDGFDLFRTDDLSIVNLECPVTTRGTRRVKPFTFRMKPAALSAITSAGIEVVNLANNHIYDYGSIGLFDTIHSLDSARIAHVGAGRNRAEARTPFLKVIKGRRIAVLGYYGPGESPVATNKSSGVAPRQSDVIAEDIRSLRDSRRADYIVIIFHWGTEKATVPDNEQRVLAHQVIDAGADAVIGHHPHVLQGIERYKHGVIVYSLGNLIFGGNSRHTYDTGLFEIRLVGESPKYEFIPVRVKNWNAQMLSGKDGDQLLYRMRKLSTIFPRSIFN